MTFFKVIFSLFFNFLKYWSKIKINCQSFFLNEWKTLIYTYNIYFILLRLKEGLNYEQFIVCL